MSWAPVVLSLELAAWTSFLMLPLGLFVGRRLAWGSFRAKPVVEALIAGVDWLLVSGTPMLPNLVDAVLEAVDREHLSSARLHEAARAVGTLTHDIG